MKWVWIILGIVVVVLIIVAVFASTAKAKDKKDEDPLAGYKPLGKVTFRKGGGGNTLIVPDGYSEYNKETETFSSAKFRTDFKLIGSENIEGGKTKIYILNSKYYDGEYKVMSIHQVLLMYFPLRLF